MQVLISSTAHGARKLLVGEDEYDVLVIWHYVRTYLCGVEALSAGEAYFQGWFFLTLSVLGKEEVTRKSLGSHTRIWNH